MNSGRSASPSASSRRHLGKINGAGLTETTAASLRGGGGDVCKQQLPFVGRTDRDIEVAELEVRKGGQVTNPSPPTRLDRYSRAAVRGVGVALGKQTNRAELGRTHSWERRMMQCWLS